MAFNGIKEETLFKEKEESWFDFPLYQSKLDMIFMQERRGLEQQITIFFCPVWGEYKFFVQICMKILLPCGVNIDQSLRIKWSKWWPSYHSRLNHVLCCYDYVRLLRRINTFLGQVAVAMIHFLFIVNTKYQFERIILNWVQFERMEFNWIQFERMVLNWIHIYQQQSLVT